MTDSKIYALPRSHTDSFFAATSIEASEINIQMSYEQVDPPTVEGGVETITVSMEDLFRDDTSTSEKIYALPKEFHRYPTLVINTGTSEEENNNTLGATAADSIPEPSAPLVDSNEASAPPLSVAVDSIEINPILQSYFPGKDFRDFQFNKSINGPNIQFDGSFQEATRIDHAVKSAYIFSANPLKEMETVLVEVSKTSNECQNSLTIGVTACDPQKLKISDLPEAHDELMDKPDYWVYKENINNSPRVGDILGFTLVRDGRIMYQRNDDPPTLLMHVDGSVNLWLFFDILGQATALKSTGCFTASSFKKLPDTSEAKVLTKVESFEEREVCVVCMDKPKQMAAIPCGHYAMCSTCAEQVRNTTNRCPLCQSKIKNLQRIYK